MQHDVIGDRTGGLHKVNGREGVSVRSREDGLVVVTVVTVVCVRSAGHDVGADAGASVTAPSIYQAFTQLSTT